MRITIDVDCTPVEARTFLGLPDLAPMNEMIVTEMTRRAKDNLDTLADPERLVKQWMDMGGKGIDALSGMMGAAMSRAGKAASGGGDKGK